MEDSLTNVKSYIIPFCRNIKWFFNLGSIHFSSPTKVIPARTGPKRDPIAAPSLCWYMLLLNVNGKFLYIIAGDLSFVYVLFELLFIFFHIFF